MSNLIFNEIVKLRATWFNNLSIASIVTGVVIPSLGMYTSIFVQPLEAKQLTVYLLTFFFGAAMGMYARHYAIKMLMMLKE